jgi:glucose-1-phosphate adenylyltransferase
MQDVTTAILGGGAGSRLSPLTRYRSKPAVPFGGKFRLIDIPISNSLHAGYDRIYVITQFLSASLHQHINQTYRFDTFRGGFVEILAAEQGLGNRDWFQGTADAIRQTLPHLLTEAARDILILSGDQLYLMRMDAFVARHREMLADLTIAVKPVHRSEAKALGIMRVDDEGRIVEFVEKPQDDRVLDRLALDRKSLERLGFDAPDGSLLASMGIYVFRQDILTELLRGTKSADFGKEVIPSAIQDRRVFAFGHTGYWRDIGTIPSFHEASLDLTRPIPPLNLYDPDFPIYTHARFLPGTKINECKVEQSILCEGSIITKADIKQAIVGIRAVVRAGSVIENSLIFGARFYEALGAPTQGIPLGIGKDCVIKNAIIDLDARIGNGVRITNEKGVKEFDGDFYSIRDGIVVVPRSAIIPAGTVI